MKRITTNKVRLGLTLKATRNDGTVYRCLRRSRMSFFTLIASLQNKDYMKYYIKVFYGYELDRDGKKTESYNDGTYTKKGDLLYMFRAFTEKPLLDDIEKELV